MRQSNPTKDFSGLFDEARCIFEGTRMPLDWKPDTTEWDMDAVYTPNHACIWNRRDNTGQLCTILYKDGHIAIVVFIHEGDMHLPANIYRLEDLSIYTNGKESKETTHPSEENDQSGLGGPRQAPGADPRGAAGPPHAVRAAGPRADAPAGDRHDARAGLMEGFKYVTLPDKGWEAIMRVVEKEVENQHQALNDLRRDPVKQEQFLDELMKADWVKQEMQLLGASEEAMRETFRDNIGTGSHAFLRTKTNLLVQLLAEIKVQLDEQ